jgi:hypothetical protein
LRQTSSFGFAIESGALRNFNQILIVGGTPNFGLRGLEFFRFVLHRKSSEQMCGRDPLEADGAGWLVIREHGDDGNGILCYSVDRYNLQTSWRGLKGELFGLRVCRKYRFNEHCAQSLPQVGVGAGFRVRLRMERCCRLRSAGIGRIHCHDAGAATGGVNQQLRRKAALVSVVVDKAMAGDLENKKAQTHHGLRAMRAGSIRRWRLTGLGGGQHTGPKCA